MFRVRHMLVAWYLSDPDGHEIELTTYELNGAA